jgi:phosphatidylserine/phosphatidylglycerophosphate/cardiolipin synthase-like enzyme
MKKLSLYINIIYLLGNLIIYSPKIAHATPADVDIYFSPKGGCQNAIVNEINRAKKEILVQAYIFTSEPIATALIKAKNRPLRKLDF